MDDTGGQFRKIKGKEPRNCNELGSAVAGEPYRKAVEYINQDPAHICCTIWGDKVQLWERPCDVKNVELKKAAMSETNFFCSRRLPIADTSQQ